MDMSWVVGHSVASLGGERGVLRLTVEWACVRARNGRAPFVGVVARGGVVIGAGANAAALELDPTAHSEVVAIRDTARRSGSLDLSGCVVYSNAEPCALCLLVAASTRADEMAFAAGRQLVPWEIDPHLDRTSRLIDAVGAVLLIRARRVDTGLTTAELSAPFRLFLDPTAR
jgi:tRNA(Arg) A34 adenosine deaminase TadA